jgi:hypothetical protein
MYEPEGVEVCPGSEGCDEEGDGTLKAGAASRSIMLRGFERPTEAGVDDDNYMSFPPNLVSEDVWRDCGRDGLCPGDAGYDGADVGEGDGELQGLWLAGFSAGRPAQYCPEALVGCDRPECCESRYAHDDVEVQIAALRRNDVTVVFAALDAVGWFHTDVDRIRERLPDDLDVDLLVMAGTHTHEAPDTVGQWGPASGGIPARSGRNPRHVERIYSQTVDGIRAAVEELEPAEVRAEVLDVGVEGLGMGDSRPPYVFNDDLPVVRLVSKGDSETIATLLSFGNHAEVLWSENPYVTADYPHFVRTYLREGIDAVRNDDGEVVKPELPGLGGVSIFFAGSIGGLINPGDGDIQDYAGDSPEETHSFEAADALGQHLASHVLEAVESGALEREETPKLSFARREFLTPIANAKFQRAAYTLGVLERDIYNAARLGPGSYTPGPPQALSEVAVVRLGGVTFFTAPGEVFPETLVGGFPGKPTVRDPVVGDVRELNVEAVCNEEGLPVEDGTGSHPCIVAPDQTNPPDWSKAPDPPYVYEQIPGEHPFFIGLGQDFLGYMVPRYDHEADGYFSQPPGSHYEETNGAGPELITDWKDALGACLERVSGGE